MIPKTATPRLISALHYPFKGNKWLRHILPLVFVQLIPVVGQVILLGYGMEVARAVYLEQTELPTISWVKTMRNGGIFVVTGLLYLIPLLAVLPIILTVGINRSSPTTVGTSNISGDDWNNSSCFRCIGTIAHTE